MKADRFLRAILIAIGLLIVLSLVLFFVRQSPQEYGPDDSPEGVVRNYTLALQEGDYQRAYGYLQDAQYKPDFTQFQQALLRNKTENLPAAVQLGDVEITGNNAHVNLTVIHAQNGPLNRTWDETTTALLVLQDGVWRIVSMPYPYWGWEWYSSERL